MASPRYFSRTGLGHRDSEFSAVQEKYGLQHRFPSRWFIPVSLSLPGVRTRRIRLFFPNPRRLYHSSVVRFGRRTGSTIFFFGFLLLACATFALTKSLVVRAKKGSIPFVGKPSTLVFEREDLKRIWHWEIASGHYPSYRSIPQQLGFLVPPRNPTISFRRDVYQRPPGAHANSTRGIGPKRTYLDIKAQRPNVAYPPRPVPGSVADLDVIMDHCDPWEEKKYVRDCLELLRVGGGLDNGNRLRRAKLNEFKYIFMEDAAKTSSESGPAELKGQPLPPPAQHRPYVSLPTPCDPENPRVFHMFWAGPFTDKPYNALLSFLFTQNTGLHLEDPPDATICRPQIWMWINPGSAASVPNPSALRDMYIQLKNNAWASPFLHPRFKGIIEFKLWNTTEQLDGVPELKEKWRKMNLFNSGGNVITVPQDKKPKHEVPQGTATGVADDILDRAGSTSSSTYDRLTVILSDMARFVLCHRYGGTYLDADTIFLRDWEELWGWKGAFAYRWSWMKSYNTAVLHMNKGSALGTFLFNTALKNGLDFHPETIARYTKDAYLEGLLLRLPDALFDSPWLNTDRYQRERPPQPYFQAFSEFFDTPTVSSAAPQALGFNAFFKGAYSYHYHNFWWKPFDPVRNWPDLGTHFATGERMARAALSPSNQTANLDAEEFPDVPDRQDLSWATVMKRTFEAYIRGETPNMYGEWLQW
ncbi:hypothetical protein FPV67DRAFT_1486354 [Lyophyllum atratum]|nr:hypothetical protein FPV67DRAFT_1486354 [Lyophyllum atratum]